MSSARENAERWLEFGQNREDRVQRKDAFEQSQIEAILAVADEIRALREALEPLKKPSMKPGPVVIPGGENE